VVSNKCQPRQWSASPGTPVGAVGGSCLLVPLRRPKRTDSAEASVFQGAGFGLGRKRTILSFLQVVVKKVKLYPARGFVAGAWWCPCRRCAALAQTGPNGVVAAETCVSVVYLVRRRVALGLRLGPEEGK
jgi:hypothetical protein